MKTRVIAKRYAEAFIKVIASDHLEDSFEEFQAFMALLADPPELFTILKHPEIKHEQKLNLIDKVFAGTLFPNVANFIKVLLERRRINLIGEIAEEVEILYRRAKNLVSVKVTTAVSLNSEELKLLQNKLSKKVHGTVEIQETVNPSIMGGLLISMGDRILDTSIKTKIKHLREKLSNLEKEWLEDLEIPAFPAP